MKKQTVRNDDVVRVAVDDGYAQVKACLYDGSGKIFECVIPTFVAPNDDGVTSLNIGEDANKDGWYETEGQRFMCGPGVNGEEVRFDNYHTSPWNRVAIHHALHGLGLAGKKVHLTVGLPIGDYFNKGKANTTLIDQKKVSLQVPVTRIGETDHIEIVAVDVSPQGISAYIDYVFDAKGGIANKQDGQIAIVDIGGRTVDVAVINAQLNVDFKRSGTNDVGVLDVREALAEQICNEKELKRLPLPAAEIAVRTGSVRLFGKPHDCSQARDEIIQTVGKRLIFAIERIVGDVADIDCILFVGGGAHVFAHLRDHYPQGASLSSPELANARGMLKRSLAMSGTATAA